MCVQYRGGLSTVEGVQYRGSTVGGYLEYRGGVQYRGGYHDKCGGYLGKFFLLFEYPTVLNTTHGLMISPHSTQISKDGIPHGTKHPPRYS